MTRVAGELGFTPMSLYRYVAGKDELLQLMWNASATGAETLELEGNGWRERFRNWALIQRDMLDRHPWITEMPMARPPVAPNSLSFVERGLEALDDTGLADADKLRLIGLISSFTLSEARLANEANRARAQAPDDAPQWTFESLLRELVDEETFPRLHRIAAAADVSRAPSPDDERHEFAFGLERILDGVGSLIERGGATDGSTTCG